MGEPLRSRLTYEDYCLLPEDGRRHEVIGGEHIAEPAPSTYHQKVSRWLQHQLFEQIELAGRGQVFNAPTDLQLSRHDVVQPDLLVVLAEHEERIGEAKIEGAPDLVVEILSPWSSRRDRELKRELYRSRGVAEYWIVDPDARAVEQLVLEPDGSYRLEGRWNERIAAATIEGVVVDLTKVW